MARKRLGEMLIEAGVLDVDKLEAALREQRKWGHPLGRIIVELGYVTEATLVQFLAKQFGVPTVDLDTARIAPHLLQLVPFELALHYNVIPFAQQLKFLDLAMVDPTNDGIIDELRIRTQLNIRPHLAGPKSLARAIALHYRGEQPARDASIEIEFDVDTVRPRAGQKSIAPQPPPPPSAPPPRATPVPAPGSSRDAEIDALQLRISRLEALVERDEQVLRKLLALLVDKDIATREEILERIK